MAALRWTVPLSVQPTFLFSQQFSELCYPRDSLVSLSDI